MKVFAKSVENTLFLLSGNEYIESTPKEVTMCPALSDLVARGKVIILEKEEDKSTAAPAPEAVEETVEEVRSPRKNKRG